MYVDTIAFTNDRTDEAKALIKKAAGLLEHYGWVKGAYSLSSGYCLVGALMQASTGKVDLSALDEPAVCVAINLVAAHLPALPTEEATSHSTTCPLHSRVETWNDQQRRTKKQVLALMRKSAA